MFENVRNWYICAEWERVAKEDEDGALGEGDLHLNSKFQRIFYWNSIPLENIMLIWNQGVNEETEKKAVDKEGDAVMVVWKVNLLIWMIGHPDGDGDGGLDAEIFSSS